MTPEQAGKNESIRNDLMDYLGARPRIAQSAQTIHRKLAKENPDYSLPEIRDGLNFLVGLGYVRASTDTLGGTHYFEITAQGTLYIERKFGL